MLLTRSDVVVAHRSRKKERIKNKERERERKSRSPMSTIVEIHETYCVDIYI